MKEHKLVKKIKGMKGSDIIMAMVEGLKKPATAVDMNTYGSVKRNDSLRRQCFGCAATNTICEIAGIDKLTVTEIEPVLGRFHGTIGDPKKFDNYFSMADYLAYKSRTNGNFINFIGGFERAIDSLRLGSLFDYNLQAAEFGFAGVKGKDGLYLRSMDTYDYKDVLPDYIELAEYNKSIGN